MKRIVKSNFPNALRQIRLARGMPQEAFDQVSSRTYVSALERGIKVPTLGKIEQLAEQLQVHPLTLLALAYGLDLSKEARERLMAQVLAEVASLELAAGA
jgi:transcriptional regulator with XRE-family HTH domain